MVERIVVVGAGGFGRETLDVLDAAIAVGAPFELAGVVDSGPREIDLERLAARRLRYLGVEAHWFPEAVGDERFIVAIGSPIVRASVSERFLAQGFQPATAVIHPDAVIGSQSRIGRGVVITAGVQVSTNVQIGDHVHLNPACVLGHDATLHDFVSVNPGAIVSGNVIVHRQVLLGAGSVVLAGVSVGESATVGAAACVTKDVLPGSTVVGVPARTMHQGTAS